METKTCQSCKKKFVIEPDDFSFYEKIKVAPPTFCPECRLIRRLASRNERFLHSGECGLCKKKILSMYAPGETYTVYCPGCWWSDGWDPGSYSRNYDFSRPFFEQYLEFKKTVPHEALYQSNFVNSEYANFGDNYKECYLVSGGWDNERLYYASQVNNISDSFDILLSNHLEFCYETIQSSRSSQLRYCNACEDSSDLFMCTDCRGCVSCFGCVGLRNKQYQVFNQQYSKNEYAEFIEKLEIHKYSSVEEIKKRFSEFALLQPYRSNRFRNAVDCTGDNIADSKNAKDSWAVNGVEDVRYTFFLSQEKNTYDVSFVGKGGERLYEVVSSFGGESQVAGVRTLFDRNSFYCENCSNCNDIFGCIGLKKKAYCIFNKEYSKEEFANVRDRIIEDMKTKLYRGNKDYTYTFGDFWPIEFQPFAYNETKAQEYFPLTKEEILERGYKWRDREDRHYKITHEAGDLPDSILESPDALSEAIIGCLHTAACNDNCTRAFKILKAELEFCRRMNVPIPRLCPNCRHMERIRMQNPLKLWHRSCMCTQNNHGHNGTCQNEFETSYAPDQQEIIYCEKCYQQEVV